MELDRELKPFIVYLNDAQLRKRLRSTEAYADPEYKNCAHLVLTMLGIVNPKDYLRICSLRRTTTHVAEIISYIRLSLTQCGADDRVEERLFDVDSSMLALRNVPPNYATLFGIQWRGIVEKHMVFLHKTSDNVLEYIDPQTILLGHPRKIIGEDNIREYLTREADVISLFFSYVSIGEADSLSERCMTTNSPMDVEGGKKKSRRLRKNGKKTKKGRKHHAVRTRGRRN